MGVPGGGGHTCFRNSIDGTGWSLKTAWTDRTAPTAPFRTAEASSSYVLSVRLREGAETVKDKTRRSGTNKKYVQGFKFHPGHVVTPEVPLYALVAPQFRLVSFLRDLPELCMCHAHTSGKSSREGRRLRGKPRGTPVCPPPNPRRASPLPPPGRARRGGVDGIVDIMMYL